MQNLAQHIQIDVPARDDDHDGPRTRPAGQCGGKRQGAGTFRDDARLLGHQPDRIPGLFQGDDQVVVHHGFHALPHAREHAAGSRSVDEGWLPVRKCLRRAHPEGALGGSGCLGLHAPYLDAGLQRLDRAADTRDEAAAADGDDDGRRIGFVLQYLESDRAVPRDEIMIVEWMHEGSFDTGKRALAQRPPGRLQRRLYDGCAQRFHALDLGGRRGVECHDRALHSGLPRGISDALTRVSRADGPNSPLTRRFRQHRHRVRRAAKLVGIDGLKILQFEADIGMARSGVEPNQRSAYYRPRNSLPRSADFAQFNGSDRFEVDGHHVFLAAALAAAAARSATVCSATVCSAVAAATARVPRAFKMKYATETNASQGTPTIHEMRQVSLSRPMVMSTAHSSVRPAIWMKGNQ